MDMQTTLPALPVLPLALTIVPGQVLKLPRNNQGNTLRGAFGVAFRRLVCVPECRGARECPLQNACPYKLVFEPEPPPDSDRLSKNQDVPRPFVFRPPLVCDATAATGPYKTTYEAGEPFCFSLILFGKAVDYLPYFVLSFREVTRAGFGLNRATCELEEVQVQDLITGRGQPGERGLPAGSGVVYNKADQLFHSPAVPTMGEYVSRRLRRLLCEPEGASGPRTLSVRFLTPTYLKHEGKEVRVPQFHHLLKRVRDRLNALATFYGPGPIDADFKGLGESAERVPTIEANVRWVERSRTSSKTGQRHELSGVVGECVYDCSRLPGNDIRELIRWLLAGEVIHAGKHTAWGDGRYEVSC